VIAVDKNEAFAIADPLSLRCGVFFLTRRVQVLLAYKTVIDDNLLAVGIFDGWIEVRRNGYEQKLAEYVSFNHTGTAVRE